MNPTHPPADWYNDPEHAGTERWWDGQRWTEYRRPGRQPPPPDAAARAASLIGQPIPQPPGFPPPQHYAQFGQNPLAAWPYGPTQPPSARRGAIAKNKLISVIVAIGSLLVIGAVVSGSLTHIFHDDRWYKMGQESARHGTARNFYDRMGMDPENACELDYRTRFMFSSPPKDFDKDDFMKGCIEGLK
ncbi:DUF2510 domain-containing protein [Mycobacterium sp.]|uniref:DUF2510 domain-containing protein n=1 Tax=Mycobacterium sp. TaxID=1785 RepID=UPI0025F23A75|nr:DUF2510 domain-containing protein [Mycobacterium sp.]